MDWDDMRLFLGVARAESLSRAGRVLRLDPATLSRRIARLEEALGQRLFVKSPQGYSLTEAGTRILIHAERAENALTAAQDTASPGDDRLSGQIRIGAPDGCASFVLPQVIAAICADHPLLEVQIVALPRISNLSKREADMAITLSRPRTGRLTVQKLADYHLHLAASAEYLARHPLQDLAEIVAHRTVGYIADMIYDKELDYLAEIGVERPSLASNSVTVQLNLLRGGAGIGIVHDFAMPSAPDLVAVLPDQVAFTRSYWLVRHADDTKVTRLNRFAAILMAGMRAEIARLEVRAEPCAASSE